MIVRSLSFHARYRCERSGACCTSNWPIPIEADRLARMQAAIAAGTLRTALPTDAWMTMPPDAPEDAPALLAMSHGRCVFFDSTGDRSCRIHEMLGHDSLPLACRQFPRIAVHDPRGVSVTLSHYCPTAASLLAADGPVSICEDPPAFPAAGGYDGLDAAMALPPLLRPDMLMDWNSWWAWEAASVALLTADGVPIAVRLGRLRRAVDEVHEWSPSDGPLRARVERAFDTAQRSVARPLALGPDAIAQRLQEIDEAIPHDLRPDRLTLIEDARTSPVPTADAGRFLAAHAFANWTAHLGDDLRAWLRSIEAAYACLLAGLDFRQADLRLRHLASPNALAKIYGARGL